LLLIGSVSEKLQLTKAAESELVTGVYYMTLTERIEGLYVIFRRPVTGSRPTAKNFDANNRLPLVNKEICMALLNNGQTGTG
jgi:hypothetical protein